MNETKPTKHTPPHVVIPQGYPLWLVQRRYQEGDEKPFLVSQEPIIGWVWIRDSTDGTWFLDPVVVQDGGYAQVDYTNAENPPNIWVDREITTTPPNATTSDAATASEGDR